MHRRGFTRRAAVLSGLAAVACAPSQAPKVEPHDDTQLYFSGHMREIEARIGGRVGVAAWNTASDAWLVHRPQERFAMCSMFKWLLAAQMLQMNEHAPGFLGQQVRFTEADLADLGHAPVTRAHVAQGSMSVRDLAEAALVQSDNGAANLLLAGAMGPEGFTRFLRANGDAVTRLDRIEPALNENLPGDERDTTTPDAMARIMQRVVMTSEVLNASSRETLTNWLIACQTGLSRLRGGLPAEWRAGDKTGTSDSDHNATTDVAIAWPPRRAPIVIAAFLSDSNVALSERNAAHAEIARIVAETWS
jgi:beta-lactamase class A